MVMGSNSLKRRWTVRRSTCQRPGLARIHFYEVFMTLNVRPLRTNHLLTVDARDAPRLLAPWLSLFCNPR